MLVSLDIMLGLGETKNLDFVVATIVRVETSFWKERREIKKQFWEKLRKIESCIVAYVTI